MVASPCGVGMSVFWRLVESHRRNSGAYIFFFVDQITHPTTAPVAEAERSTITISNITGAGLHNSYNLYKQ